MSGQEAEVKRFVAPTMSRALELVKLEMGPEAIILSSSKVKGGVEVVTSIDRDLPTRGIEERRTFGQNFDTELDQALASDVSWESQAGIEQAAAQYPGQVEINGMPKRRSTNRGAELAEEIERAREKMLAAKNRAAEEEQQPVVAPELKSSQASYSAQQTSSAAEEQKLESLKSELADLRMMLERQLWSNSKSEPLNDNETSGQAGSVLMDHLRRLGLGDDIIRELQIAVQNESRVSEAWKKSLATLAKRLPISSRIKTEGGGVFAFVGPTGVGKTTSLAKLAARYTMANGPGKVALVSMDVHRVGAVEQLRSLGKILDAPVRIVDDSNSLMTVLSGLRHFPLVLIDTAGFRQGDPLLKAQLAELDENPSVKRLLVLSSSSQLQTLKASIHAYKSVRSSDACILTKLDETCSLGEALTAVIQHQIPVSYLTNGQQIPKDIESASSSQLIANAVSMAKQGHRTSSFQQ